MRRFAGCSTRPTPPTLDGKSDDRGLHRRALARAVDGRRTGRHRAAASVPLLEALLGVDGTTTAARILKSIPEIDEAALDAVRQWQYEPVLLNGAPVPVMMTMTIHFALS